MAKSKSELLAKAKELKLDVTEKNTIAEITEAIKSSSSSVTLNHILKTPLEPEQAKDIKIQVQVEESIGSNDLLVYVTIQNTDPKDSMPTKVVVGIDGNWLKAESTISKF